MFKLLCHLQQRQENHVMIIALTESTVTRRASNLRLFDSSGETQVSVWDDTCFCLGGRSEECFSLMLVLSYLELFFGQLFFNEHGPSYLCTCWIRALSSDARLVIFGAGLRPALFLMNNVLLVHLSSFGYTEIYVYFIII